jgi:UDP-glucose 4-epimerase
MNILITGATGFIGTELINYLSNKKLNIFGISHTKNSDNIKKISLNNPKELNQFMSKNSFDVVVHLASMIQNDEPMKIFNSNCKTTINLLDNCIKNGIKKFIFSSSHAVYGKTDYLPIDEIHSTNPQTNYGITKLICEQITKMYSDSYDITTLNLRLTSVYGTNLPKERIISKIISSVIKNKQIKLHKYTNGFQVMDLLHVEDACHAIELACKSNIPSNTYNIASGNPITIEQISKIVSKITRKDFFKIEEINSSTNHFFYDISKSKKDLKFIPKHQINYKTLCSLIEHYQNQ